MFNESNLLFFLLIVSLLVISVGWMIFGDTPMFKKRYLPILVLVFLLFAIGAIVSVKKVAAIRSERSQMIEACLTALSSDRLGYTFYECGSPDVYSPLKYERIKSSPLSVTVYFHDGTNDMWCHMQRNSSKWIVAGTGSTIAAPCP
ncbi:MAG TPA: hypothetical protein V6C97_32915 [Oculatellaceae cyanobacterium]